MRALKLSFFLFILAGSILTGNTVHGQATADSVRSAGDTVKKKTPFQPDPKKAGLYSALLPGSGQVYNRQYWKVPVVYAGLGAAAYFINFNYRNYNRYRTAYIATIDTDPNTISTEIYSSADLKQLQDQYKQWLDMTVLITSLGYMLQVMDAVVFAHLKNFDISPDISVRFKPMAMPNGGGGFGLAFQF
ncbi:MAG: hypothetical protein JNL72_01740 [Flavipsychrobacter sp.]|nr:hypothetical protein [Flavipsychrobacter sp.]